MDWSYKIPHFLKLNVCVGQRYGDTYDAKFIDVLFDGRAGLYITTSPAVVEAVELLSIVIHE